MITYEFEGHELIFIDESGFEKDMPRKYGCSEKGKRCYGTHDWQSKTKENVIGALWDKTIIAAQSFSSYINTEIFYGWLKDNLLPKIKRWKKKVKPVIIMDNASFHKDKKIRKAIEDAGCILEYQPAYSPDLNPIENKWAQVKVYIKKHQCSVKEAVSKFMGNYKFKV